MENISPSTLLMMVPLLPLAGAILTLLFGKALGSRAHLPAIAGIAGAALISLVLLVSTSLEVGVAAGV